MTPPTLVANQINGKPILRFHGTSDTLTMVEMMAWSRAISAREMYQAQEYLGKKYGVRWLTELEGWRRWVFRGCMAVALVRGLAR